MSAERAPGDQSRPAAARRRPVRFCLASFLVLNVVWLALISAFDVAEMVLGIVAAAIGATAVRQTGLVSFRPRARWLLPIWRLPVRTVVETVVVFGALWRRLVHGTPTQGRFRTEPFPLRDDASRAAARRAVRTIGESVAPNTYVVGIDQEEHTVLVHELVPARRARR